MKSDVFGYSSYKEILTNWVEDQPHNGRGAKSQLARMAGCQAAYISQVLNGDLNLSLEQAQSLVELLGLGTDEAHFFLLLVQRERAGSASLRRYFQEQIETMLRKRFVLKDRLGLTQPLGTEEQQIYYSSWLFAAIHVLTDIPEFQNKEAIAKKLNLPVPRVADLLEFLVRTGLVLQDRDRFVMSTKSIHLGSDSPLIAKHHTNWRMRAVTSLESADGGSLHYSSAVTLSREDLNEVKAKLIETIREVKAKVKVSKQEGMYCFALDLFEI